MKEIGGSGDQERIEVGKHGISYVSFQRWREELLQGTTLRYRNADPMKPFDLVGWSGSGSQNILENWELFLESVSRSSLVVVEMEQNHGNAVEVLKFSRQREKRLAGMRLTVKGCDGVISDDPNLLLTVRVADCIPIFIRDSSRGVIGLVHAGWRGTASNILQAAITRMGETFGSRPSDLSIYMGPSIEKACYPVDLEVYRRFSRWRDPDRPATGEWKVDLPEINTRQALEAGVPGNRIFRSRYCTCCSTDLFYSHRALKGQCGRMVSFMSLCKQNPS
jgi:YfiH family protein